MNALVSVVITLIVPLTLTPTVPPPTATPTVLMSSLLVAVTTTPRRASVTGATSRLPLERVVIGRVVGRFARHARNAARVGRRKLDVILG